MSTPANKITAFGFVIAWAAVTFVVTAKAAGNSPCLPATTTANEVNQLIYQEFPARGPTETAWKVVWSERPPQGLWVENAWFTPKPGAAPILVLGPSGLSNIFVPYHDGDPSRRDVDLNAYTFLREAVPAYTGPCGTISGPAMPNPSWIHPAAASPPRPVLIKEIRDRGVAWTSDGRLRRGEELLLWGVMDAGNYEYIVQYGFRDDGTITFRMGSTGYNYPNSRSLAYLAHMHNALWYVDIDVGDTVHNSAQLMTHHELLGSSNPKAAMDSLVPFNGGVEGFADWNAEEFTCLNIENTVIKNARGNNISYDLMPMRTGTARHDESYSKHDFWVTQQNSAELDFINGLGNGAPYTTQPQSITNTNVAIWYISSNHHMPRDEDQEFDAQGNWKSGIAQVMWSGFDLHPRNLMDDAPLYGCAQISPPPVAWWPFEENMGAKCIVDISGNANKGTPYPGPLGPTSVPDSTTTNPTWTGPIAVLSAASGGLSFNGTSQYVEVADAPSLNFGLGDFSVDTWIKAPNSGGVTTTILDKRTNVAGKYQGYSLYLLSGKLGLQLADGINPYANYTSNTMLSDGYTHHVAVTVNRTGTPKQILWYVDGNNVDTTPAPLAGSLTNASPLRLGSRSFQLGGYFNGVLGETELFNRVLTPLEVHDIYAAGKCRPSGPPPPCLCVFCQ
jgi:Concanavalin A-like lectin/glucanases superfamily/Copper amine oxidase, enzyme domain